MTRLLLTVTCAALCLQISSAALAAPSPGKPGAAHASSFAPRTSGHRHVYGAPIQPPIMKRRTVHRRQAAGTQPVLRSEPLPGTP